MVKLDTPITVSRQIVGFTIQEMNDSPVAKSVRAGIRISYADGTERARDVTLWQGDEYDKAGDWTQEQAEQRVIEVLS